MLPSKKIVSATSQRTFNSNIFIAVVTVFEVGETLCLHNYGNKRRDITIVHLSGVRSQSSETL